MKIEANKVVSLNYKLTNHKTGEKIEETTAEHPMVFLFGVESIIPDFEVNISGKTVGDTFAFAIESANAYGNPSDEQIAMIPLDVFFMEDGKVNTEEIYVGAKVPMSDNEGHQLLGTVLDINEEFVKMDFNHPLAGIDLHFEGEIIGVREASAEEVSHGHVHGEHGHQH
jgi:FKBP-type peptidyl-prolyl cis-trans isomerase SlyD